MMARPPYTHVYNGSDSRSGTPTLRRRLVISAVVALVSGSLCWAFLNYANFGAGDFTWSYLTGKDLLAGLDPYRLTPNRNWIPYPLPAALVGVIFSPLPATIAGATFFGLSSGILAFGLTRRGLLYLMAFLACPYWVSLTLAQWTPLIMAAAFFPVLAAVLVIKPHTAAPVVLTRLSKVAIISCAVLLATSLAIYPTWPLKWITQLGGFQLFFPLFTIPGPLLLLALKRWKDNDARLLLLASVFPQRWLYDGFVLWLIPKTRKEFLYTALASWVGWIWRLQRMQISTFELGLLCVMCFYLPMLVVILKRGDSG